MSNSKNGKGKNGSASDGAVIEGYGEWKARDRNGNLIPVLESRMRRDTEGGYTFTDSAGVLADFPPGVLEYVMRVAASPASPRFVELPPSIGNLVPAQIRDLQAAINRVAGVQGRALEIQVLPYGSKVARDGEPGDGAEPAK